MIKIFLKDSFIYTLSNLLTKGIGFLMLPIYTTFFNPAQFGVLDLLIVTGTILSVLIGLEIHQAVARFFPEESSLEEKRKIVSTAFWSVLILYLFFLIPSILFSKSLSNLFFNTEDYASLIKWALLSYGFNFIYYFSSSQLRWQLKSKENLVVSFLYSVISALGAYVLLKYDQGGIESVFIAQMAAGFVCALLSGYYARDYYKTIFDYLALTKMLNFSAPLIFSTLTVYGMLYVDRLMISALLNSEDLGYYAFAYRIASVVSLLTLGLQSALTPLIYSQYRKKESAAEIAKLFHLFAAASGVFLVGLALLGPTLVKWIGSEQYLAASDLIPWVAFSMLFMGLSNFTPGILIAKKTKYVFYINLISFLLNCVVGYAMIRWLGLRGAIYATAFCSFCYFSMYYVIGQKYYFIPFFWTRLKR